MDLRPGICAGPGEVAGERPVTCALFYEQEAAEVDIALDFIRSRIRARQVQCRIGHRVVIHQGTGENQGAGTLTKDAGRGAAVAHVQDERAVDGRGGAGGAGTDATGIRQCGSCGGGLTRAEHNRAPRADRAGDAAIGETGIHRSGTLTDDEIAREGADAIEIQRAGAGLRQVVSTADRSIDVERAGVVPCIVAAEGDATEALDREGIGVRDTRIERELVGVGVDDEAVGDGGSEIARGDVAAEDDRFSRASQCGVVGVGVGPRSTPSTGGVGAIGPRVVGRCAPRVGEAGRVSRGDRDDERDSGEKFNRRPEERGGFHSNKI